MQHTLKPFSRKNIVKTAAILLSAAAVLILWGSAVFSALRIIFGACLIAFLITPVTRFIEKKFKRSTASFLALLLTALAAAAAVGLLLPVMIRQLSGAAELLPESFRRVRSAAESFALHLQRRIPELQMPQLDFSALEDGIGSIARQGFIYAGSLAGSVYRLVLTIILACFLMADRDRILLRAELAVPSPWRRLAVRMGSSLMRELRLYLRGQALIALAVGALASIALAVIGVKAAPLLGLFVGMFNVIPYFGPFIGGVPAVVMALSAGWQKAALTVLALFLVQQVDSLLLSPRIMGSITGFSPAVVLLSIFLGQQAAGVMGMLLAMPLMMSLRTAYRVFVQRHEKN